MLHCAIFVSLRYWVYIIAMCFQSVYISGHFTLCILLCWRFQSTLWITISWDASFWKHNLVFFFLRWENMIYLERYSRKIWKRNLTCVPGQIWRVRCEETGGKTRFPLVSGGKVYKNNIKRDYVQWHWKMINPYYLP